ncbi:MAG: hypothetical protein IPO07_17790 [Haliscomenobacter sp.]|nr:hypothetical protein [Haliscomenobacter sp.]MBK9490422.1 hypothetical protein [Haliscomenobacter sp.]
MYRRQVMRKPLQHLHHSDVSLMTNIERRFLQLMEGGCQCPLVLHCEHDAAGNYHVWAAKPILGCTREKSTPIFQHQLFAGGGWQRSESAEFGFEGSVLEGLKAPEPRTSEPQSLGTSNPQHRTRTLNTEPRTPNIEPQPRTSNPETLSPLTIFISG